MTTLFRRDARLPGLSPHRPRHRRLGWGALLVVAAFGLVSCTHQVSPGSPVKSNATLSIDPGAVLLDANKIDDVMGTSGSKVVDEGKAPDDTADVDPAVCHGPVYIAGEIEYASTSFTAMRWRIVAAENVSTVVEMVAQLPSVAKADEFIDDQTKGWEACAGKVITTKDKATKRTMSQDHVTAVTTRPHTVIASIDGMPGTSCQHGRMWRCGHRYRREHCGGGGLIIAERCTLKLAGRTKTRLAPVLLGTAL